MYARGTGAAVHLDFIGPLDDGTAADDFHSRAGQGALVDAVEALDLAILVCEQPGPVEARRAGVSSRRPPRPRILAEMRRVRQQLLGMQPTLTQVPPKRSDSAIATRAP